MPEGLIAFYERWAEEIDSKFNTLVVDVLERAARERAKRQKAKGKDVVYPIQEDRNLDGLVEHKAPKYGA